MDGNRPGRETVATVRLPGRRPPVERLAVIATVILVIVVSKPWQLGSGGVGTIPRPTTAPPSRPTVTPAPSSTRSPEELAAATFCLDTRMWLIASVERSVERSVDQQIRVWRALEPTTSATGPNDPSIPVVSIVSEGLTQLGWCAPIVGVAQPSAPVDVTTWTRTLNGATPITLDSSGPAIDRSPFGAMYQPPREGPSSKATLWPDGTFVFRYREGDVERWFAIDVETRRLPGRSH